ncbi:phage tail tube protein [Paenibacillus sp. JDR-2]|uniref:phage tail tube protein n=1 Tax=Paenibacillus sp. (strain JDR-2) TaxID=324057 RepID=UPI000166A36B|nr:phage tail tube protein [Paenibacillus sp. JDR-2]ACT00221.1 outer capsid protein Hoc [Paenibacillus sp. JDR-2]
MPKSKASGTKIQIGANYVAELTSISGPELSADTIDVTTLDSNGWREFLQGLKDGGEVSISGFFNTSDIGQMAVYQAFNQGSLDSYTILFPPALGASWTLNGIATGISTSAELEDVVSFEATIKVSGAPALGLTPSGGLTALSLTGAGGALTPTFSNGNYLYTFSGVTATSVTLTATAANHTLALYIDGVLSQALTSGSASAAIPVTLNVGKKLTILATESGKTTKVYEVTVAKTA